jgi:hypothetical protein
MKTLLSLIFMLCVCAYAAAQTASVVWQVNSFDVAANVQQAERVLNVVATLNATNLGAKSEREVGGGERSCGDVSSRNGTARRLAEDRDLVARFSCAERFDVSNGDLQSPG